MTFRRPTRASSAATLALALAAAFPLVGCGEDATGVPADDPSATTSEPAPSSSTSSPPTTTPSEPPSTPPVPPATGPTMALRGMTLTVPEGWELASANPLSRGAYNASGGPGVLVAGALLAVPGESFATTLRGSLQTQRSNRMGPARLEDITLDGVRAWVIRGSKPGIALEYEVGGLAGDRTFSISFQYLTQPPPDVQDTIDSVLASVDFR